jgi:FkbM family methyltransferase
VTSVDIVLNNRETPYWASLTPGAGVGLVALLLNWVYSENMISGGPGDRTIGRMSGLPDLLKKLINGTLGLAGVRLIRARPPALSPDDAALRQILTQLGISVVFDVGAHVGEYATRLRNIGYRRRIVSFEPQTAAFLVLAEKGARDPQWEPVRLALGDRVGEQDLNISANSWSSSFLPVELEMLEIETGLAQTKVETVPVTTLDQVHHRFVGPTDGIFLKIDAQGYEPNILLGADAFLARCRAVQLEMALFPSYHQQKNLVEVIKFMENKGFKLVHLERGFGDVRTGFLIEAEGVFVRQDNLPEVLRRDTRGQPTDFPVLTSKRQYSRAAGATSDRPVLREPESRESGTGEAGFPKLHGAGSSNTAMASASSFAPSAEGAAPSFTSRPSCLTSHCHSPAMCMTESSHEPSAARSTGKPPCSWTVNQ